jgi:chemotaxis protein CheX
MEIKAEISETQIKDYIFRAVDDVFQTMLRCPVTLRGAIESWPPNLDSAGAEPHVVGVVGFLGEMNGVIYLSFASRFATRCTGKMLGMSPPEVEAAGAEVVSDAIGELTNMIVGGFKNRLSDAGLPCKLTVPSVLRGTDIRVKPAGHAKQYFYLFEAAGQTIVVDIMLAAD